MSKRCPSCNIWNTDSAKFCRNCGKQFLASVQPAVPKSTTPTPTPQPSSSTSNSDGGDIFLKILGTIVVIGICVAIAVGTAGFGTPVAIGGYLALKQIWDW